jgi:hypothetical protein
MLRHITRNRLVGFWFVALAVTIASIVVLGVNVSVSNTALLLALSMVPPGIILALWRGASPQTIAEVLYAANTRTHGRS